MKAYFSHDEGARNNPKPARVKGYGNAACRRCNRRKRDKTAKTFRAILASEVA